jgi:hypothetical protein
MNGNKRLHGVGKPRRPDHTKGANRPAKDQPTPQKETKGAKTQTNQTHEGKATPKGCKWERPINRKVTRTIIQTSTAQTRFSKKHRILEIPSPPRRKKPLDIEKNTEVFFMCNAIAGSTRLTKDAEHMFNVVCTT